MGWDGSFRLVRFRRLQQPLDGFRWLGRFLFVDVFVAASGGNKWNRWFFVTFYLFGVLVILNVSW